MTYKEYGTKFGNHCIKSAEEEAQFAVQKGPNQLWREGLDKSWYSHVSSIPSTRLYREFYGGLP